MNIRQTLGRMDCFKDTVNIYRIGWNISSRISVQIRLAFLNDLFLILRNNVLIQNIGFVFSHPKFLLIILGDGKHFYVMQPMAVLRLGCCPRRKRKILCSGRRWRDVGTEWNSKICALPFVGQGQDEHMRPSIALLQKFRVAAFFIKRGRYSNKFHLSLSPKIEAPALQNQQCGPYEWMIFYADAPRHPRK